MIDIERKLRALSGIEAQLSLMNISLAQLALSHCKSDADIESFLEQYGLITKAIMEGKQ
jgi:hypothetical protein